MTPKFLENLVILCFERRYPKQNIVIHLKSNILVPPNFWAGYATVSAMEKAMFQHVHICPTVILTQAQSFFFYKRS